MRRTGKPTLWLLASCLGLAGLVTIAGCNTGSREGTGSKKSTSASGLTGTPAAPAGPAPAGLVADLRVDTNRDGALTVDDEAGEDAWSATAGAVLLNNNDDDDLDGTQDGKDSKLNGATDRDDMTQVLLLQAAQLTSQHRVTLNIDGNIARGRVRVFNDQGTVIFNPGAAVAVISATALAAGDLTIYIEAREGRTTVWDGDLTLTLTISDANGPIAQDVVALRVAPVIFPDNTRPVERVYVMKITDPAHQPNQPLIDALQRRPPGVDLFEADGATYGFDRWVQDAMQQGYQASPGVVRRSNLQAMRPRPLDPLTPDITKADTGHTWTGGSDTSHNYGGNLEITPPYAGYPFGRILIGGGQAGTLTAVALSDTMTQRQLDWLNAQQVQGPCVELSSEWLIVGHIDETFIFLPDGQGGFHLYMASPNLAKTALQALASAGQGSSKVFEGRATETTVSALLNDQALMAFNQAAQSRLDQIRDQLVSLVGIAVTDVRYMPVLFEEYTAQGHAVALNPGVQNLVCVNAPSGATTLLVPDPEGPNDTSGVDVWQEQIRQALASTGFTIDFVDVFESYHELLGEAHCGTNTERQPYAKNWWD